MEQPSTALESGEEYHTVYRRALAMKPGYTLEDGTCAVAIYLHDASDFLWLKVRGRHNIAKLKAHYLRTYNLAVELRQGNFRLSDATQIQNLTAEQDIAVFTAHLKDNDARLVPAPSRPPLRPVNTQISGGSSIPSGDEKPIVKSENEIIKSENGYNPSPRKIQGAVALSPVQERLPVKSESIFSPQLIAPVHPSPGGALKHEDNAEDEAMELDPHPSSEEQSEQLQKIMENGTPDQLEGEVRDMQILLDAIKKPLATMVSEHKDAKHWVERIDRLLSHKVDTPTVIGVVGNTGAGKSSVINALLEEERLVPTNCMRACTAVVTEMSWNYSDKPSAKFRAEIEFIKAADWEKDLRLSFSEMLDSNGQVSRECSNEESEAGIAYAKLRSVYPQKTKEMLAGSTIEKLLNEPAVKKVLGTTMTIERPKSDIFYKALQNVIDSKEKKKGEKKEMELWPLIKVVKLYTKADALSTGAVIVDLPGVHDSNAARAAVAAGYMKQCTGLFIVAPINRAVDDKAAKSLLGESFKRQLKFDGTYSRITFICSKTDDISITEATDSLGLEDQMQPDWDRIDEIEKQVKELKLSAEELRTSRQVYSEIINDLEDKIEQWEELEEKAGEGNKVWAPTPSKKRKSDLGMRKPRKKVKRSRYADSDDDFIDDAEPAEEEDEEEDDAANDSASGGEEAAPLTLEEIEEKIAMFKEDKKRARTDRTELDTKLKPISKQIEDLGNMRATIEAAMSAICVEGRNGYSRGAIQRDFADGIRELDMENAQEEDPDQFNPEDQIRDYEEVARSLPVFCVSARAYQKLSGRLLRDSEVSGFRSPDETEIPQLQAHCKKLTEGGRAANSRAFLTNFSQLLTSLNLWAANDGSGVSLSDAQLKLETRFLKIRLLALEKSLQISVKSTLTEMNDALAEHIFGNFEEVVSLATQEAPQTCRDWHRKPNRDDHAAGGYFWATYKAIMRREGVFSNANGPHDFNSSLAKPIIMSLASQWERVFAQRLPRVLQSFTRQSKKHLSAFHHEIEARSTNLGLGVAGLSLLGENLRNYEGIFSTLSSQMLELINALQREANREFTPVICRKLESTYAWCASEAGPGQFVRMKVHMEASIDQNCESMFWDSVNEVKRRLDLMREEVEEAMLVSSDDVYTNMSRDYLSVMGGSQLPEGEVMPLWERRLRASVSECIHNRDRIISDAKKAALEAKLAEEKRIAEEEAAEAARVAAAAKREKEEAAARRKRKADEEKAAKQKADEEKAAKPKEDDETAALKEDEEMAAMPKDDEEIAAMSKVEDEDEDAEVTKKTTAPADSAE